MGKPEYLDVKIDHRSEFGVDLLPDVLRQLQAMVRLLTEVATDPKYSKVEVLELSKHSPLTARLRVVTVKERPSSSPRRGGPSVKGTTAPIRRLERAYLTAMSTRKSRHVDASSLSALRDFALQLKSDVATITANGETMVVDSSLVEKIDSKLGPVFKSVGTVTGILEGLNVHTKPWHFVLYPDIGPPRLRCTFDEALFESVRHALRQVVQVRGVKEYVAGGTWPLRMAAEHVEVREPANPGAWLDLVDNLEALGSAGPTSCPSFL
jgi:hypothetical protein